MKLLEQTFDFTEEDFKANQRNQITKVQIKKIKSVERLLLVLGTCLVLIFGFLSYLTIYWYISDIPIPMKNGEPFPKPLLLGLGIISSILAIVMVAGTFRLLMNLETIDRVEHVQSLKATLKEIDYGITSGKTSIPYLVVKGVSFRHIANYNPSVFSPSATYRFYFTSNSKCLLSIEIQSSDI
ncbi:MAG: hypothetical protein O9264_08635 [Leptospira sp.]|nr:hypothetical protein [Leptospira sp.]